MMYPHRLRFEVESPYRPGERTIYLIGCQNKEDCDQILEKGKDLFYDQVIEKLIFSSENLSGEIVQVTFLPGVTDNLGRSAKEGLYLLGIDAEVFSGKLYIDTFRPTMANGLIQKIDRFEKLDETRFDEIELPLVVLDHGTSAEEINLNISDQDLLKLSDERCLALSLDELKTIQNYYKDLGRSPSDVELEILAQTWSEHCKHKIFGAEITYKEKIDGHFKKLGNKTVNSLYKSYVKKATSDVKEKRGLDWLISVFSDNAGIVRFDKNIDLCIKVETHNSPSALDPYGGALTGILGVNRDILGTGMGARPIANTNVFCVGPYQWPLNNDDSYMPNGLMNPSEILKGVHKGVEDGGNKSGIPTVNGAMAFDPGFSGKPLVFCGTVGVLNPTLPSGRSTGEKYAKPGDRVVVVGGAVGADGIHGATFSSMELDESAPATAVQIGDPITQKRVADFLIEAQSKELYSSITDNGAGGLSSSIGEMAEATNGARIDLSLSPVKYPGLSPWEIMISESQERMSLAVPVENIDEITELAKKRNVQLVDIGEFTENGNFEIFWGSDQVASLPLEFMHHGLPPMKLEANWDGPREIKSWYPVVPKVENTSSLEALKVLLADENIASKQYWVRQYDHEVQAATAIRPFVGSEQTTPNNSGVVSLAPHGGEEENAIAIGCGFAYGLSHYDPYLMAIYALDEAVRNCLVHGANPEQICLLDNFCWPDPVLSSKCPDGDYKLAQLVRTCEGLYDACLAYGMPLVSGKDSMKNDFRGKNKSGEKLDISIEPTLLVTAMAQVDSKNIISSNYKNTKDHLYLISAKKNENPSLISSVFSRYFQIKSEDHLYPDLDLNFQFYLKFNEGIKKKLFNSCHDISEGGALVALVEASFSDLSTGILVEDKGYEYFFNEDIGQFVVSIDPDNVSKVEDLMTSFHIEKLGELNDSGKVTFASGESYSTKGLFDIWQGTWSKQQ